MALPELEPLLELERPRIWFAVRGMGGGFGYELEEAGVQARLASSSYSHLVGGSGQRHPMTPEGSTLVEEGIA